jgi:DNA-binding CsgD family transcriptional regulator
MKLDLYKQELNKIFAGFSQGLSLPGAINSELNLYKKLLNYFLAGGSYYFIFNYHTLTCDVVSKEVEIIHGCKPSAFDLVALTQKIHPDDFPYFLAIGRNIEKFFLDLPPEKKLKYIAIFDVRYPNKDEGYLRILYQGMMIEQNEKGRPLRSFGRHTDISYLKKEGKPTLSFLGTDGEPSFMDIDLNNNFYSDKDSFTTREKDILKLLIEGKLSKEISDILCISKQTVDTHRKNMLHKKHLANTSELVSKAITHGWI